MKSLELLYALNIVKPGVVSKDKSLGQDYVFFDNDFVITYNNTISIRYPIKTGIKCMVKAGDLIKALSKIKDADFSMVLENDILNLKANNVKIGFNAILDPEIETRMTSIQETVGSLKWMSLPENFNEVLLLCSFAAHKNESQWTLASVYCNGENVLASDNDKVAWGKLSGTVKPMLLKASEIKGLVAIEPTNYSADKAFFHFKNDEGAIFSIRRINGEYPTEYMGFFNFDGVKFTIPTEAVQGIDLASIFVDDDSPHLTVDVSKNKCILSSGANTRGNTKFKVDIKYAGKDFSFKINPMFLKEMLKYSTDFTVGDSVARISNEDDSFSMLTSLFTE